MNKFVIVETVATGDALKGAAVVQNVDRQEYGFFDTEEEAQRKADSLGDTFGVRPLIG